MVICTFRLIVNINIFYNFEFLMILVIPASVQTEYVDLRGWACLFDRILSTLFTYFENIFLHPNLQFLYVHRVKVRLYVDHADSFKGILLTVEKRLPAPRGNFVLSRTEEFHSGPIH